MHCRSVSATGGVRGTPELTLLDTTIATILDKQVLVASCWKGRETQTWLTQMNQVGIFYLHFMAMQNKLEYNGFLKPVMCGHLCCPLGGGNVGMVKQRKEDFRLEMADIVSI